MTTRIAIYGTWEIVGWMKYRQRYWHRKKSGGKQRYWHTVKKPRKFVTSDGRYEFSGSGKELMKAIISAKYDGWAPDGYITTTANEFLRNPEKFSIRGVALDIEVQSL